MTDPRKPLGRKSYGSIGHLPGSRLGPGDHHVNEGQARICTVKARDRHDAIIVQVKLDGSCCSVWRGADDRILALGRAGYLAETSRFEQHQLFADWVRERADIFRDLLKPGERCVGEWLAQAHGTRYELAHAPYVVFDLMVEDTRRPVSEVDERVSAAGLPTPAIVSYGGPVSIEMAMQEAGRLAAWHGHLDPVEGVVYRVERKGQVEYLAKYVRPEKVDGHYLPEVSGQPAVWNWRP
jgi:hypothetical protein